MVYLKKNWTNYSALICTHMNAFWVNPNMTIEFKIFEFFIKLDNFVLSSASSWHPRGESLNVIVATILIPSPLFSFVSFILTLLALYI